MDNWSRLIPNNLRRKPVAMFYIGNFDWPLREKITNTIVPYSAVAGSFHGVYFPHVENNKNILRSLVTSRLLEEP